jgi:hypothetical protein
LKTWLASFIIASMAKKVTEEMVRLVMTEIARKGGKARAEKYPAEQLREWAKMGGRPRKDAKQRKGRGK